MGMIVLIFVVGALCTGEVSAVGLGDAFGSNLDKAAGQEGAGYSTSTSLESIISIVIQVALSFLGVIFLVLMVYGGYLWMTARGNEEQVKKAQNIIITAIVGLVIILAAYAISYLILSRLGGATLNSGTPDENNTLW